jgi:hypothetical protein
MWKEKARLRRRAKESTTRAIVVMVCRESVTGAPNKKKMTDCDAAASWRLRGRTFFATGVCARNECGKGVEVLKRKFNGDEKRDKKRLKISREKNGHPILTKCTETLRKNGQKTVFCFQPKLERCIVAKKKKTNKPKKLIPRKLSSLALCHSFCHF